MENEEYNPPPDDLISNIRNERLPLVKEAIEQSGFDLRIDLVARDDRDFVMPGYFALHTNERDRDHGPFWRLLKELEEQGSTG